MLSESISPSSHTKTTASRFFTNASTNTLTDRPCPEVPAFDPARFSMDYGDYIDVRGSSGYVDPIASARGSAAGGDGTSWRASADHSGGDGCQNISHHGYEELDPALVQPVRAQHYAELATVGEVADAEDATGRMETIGSGDSSEAQNAVSPVHQFETLRIIFRIIFRLIEGYKRISPNHDSLR